VDRKEVDEGAAFETGAARAVVLGFETDGDIPAATAIATDVSGSETGETTRDESRALVDTVRDAEIFGTDAGRETGTAESSAGRGLGWE
jgi:hypothetical protein